MKLLVGTNNKNKFEQFKFIFTYYGADNIQLVSLAELGITDDVEEDKNTLLGNARKKAKFFAEKSGLTTIADDTGFFVEALDGFPGVKAKRWLKGTERDRNLAILEKMEGVPEEKRGCRYRGVVAVYNPQSKKFWQAENDCEGVITKELYPGGFGYDGIFYMPHFRKTYGQLTEEEKISINFRGRGVKEFLDFLQSGGIL